MTTETLEKAKLLEYEIAKHTRAAQVFKDWASELESPSRSLSLPEYKRYYNDLGESYKVSLPPESTLLLVRIEQTREEFLAAQKRKELDNL